MESPHGTLYEREKENANAINFHNLSTILYLRANSPSFFLFVIICEYFPTHIV